MRAMTEAERMAHAYDKAGLPHIPRQSMTPEQLRALDSTRFDHTEEDDELEKETLAKQYAMEASKDGDWLLQIDDLATLGQALNAIAWGNPPRSDAERLSELRQLLSDAYEEAGKEHAAGVAYQKQRQRQLRAIRSAPHLAPVDPDKALSPAQITHMQVLS